VGRCESTSPTSDGKKRDRSPGARQSHNNSRGVSFKKPRSRREIMEDWNEEGTRAVFLFCEDRSAEFKTQSDEVLEQVKFRVEQALDNF
jgi:hypothetical protein